MMLARQKRIYGARVVALAFHRMPAANVFLYRAARSGRLNAQCHLLVLRNNEARIRAEAETGFARHAVAGGGRRPGIVARNAPERQAVAGPIAVEAHAPQALARQADAIILIRAVGEIDDHDHVVARPAAVPAMKRHHLVGVVDMMDVHVVTAAGRATTWS